MSYFKSLRCYFSTGTSVVTVVATDADDPTYGNSARLVYSILQGQPYFSVEPKTGKCVSMRVCVGYCLNQSFSLWISKLLLLNPCGTSGSRCWWMWNRGWPHISGSWPLVYLCTQVPCVIWAHISAWNWNSSFSHISDSSRLFPLLVFSSVWLEGIQLHSFFLSHAIAFTVRTGSQMVTIKSRKWYHLRLYHFRTCKVVPPTMATFSSKDPRPALFSSASHIKVMPGGLSPTVAVLCSPCWASLRGTLVNQLFLLGYWLGQAEDIC